MPIPWTPPAIEPQEQAALEDPTHQAPTALRELDGVEVEGLYILEAFHVLGEGDGVNGNLDLIANFNLETLLGLRGLVGSVYFLATHGDGVTDDVGDFQINSNIEAPEATRLYELWLDQTWAASGTSVRAGIFDLTSEFDVIPSGQLFIHSSPGTGAEFAASGLTGPSTFPVSSLATRLELQPTERSYLRLAVGDGVPGDPDDPQSNQVRLSSEEGAVFVGEAGFVGPNRKLAVGAWGYTTEFERPGGETSTGSAGLYAFADQPLLDDGVEGGRGLNAFLRVGFADDRNTTLDRYVGGGLVQRAPLPGRTSDALGLGVFAARFSDGGDWETAIELTYQAALTDWFMLQPDLQVVVDPSGRSDLDDAVLIGLRASIAF
ncbi:MAG: carbohydrate porin [Planctomycetota bacterium]